MIPNVLQGNTKISATNVWSLNLHVICSHFLMIKSFLSEATITENFLINYVFSPSNLTHLSLMKLWVLSVSIRKGTFCFLINPLSCNVLPPAIPCIEGDVNICILNHIYLAMYYGLFFLTINVLYYIGLYFFLSKENWIQFTPYFIFHPMVFIPLITTESTQSLRNPVTDFLSRDRSLC